MIGKLIDRIITRETLSPFANHSNLWQRYLAHKPSYGGSFDLELAINIKCYEDINKFVIGFIETLKKYHPFNLKEPDRCSFPNKTPKDSYWKPLPPFVFDIENPSIPIEIFNECEGYFRISLCDDGNRSFCFWLTYSKNNQHNISYENDNAGKGFMLQMQCMNNIEYKEMVDYIFNFGFPIRGTRYA